jgi:hypothetical protein
MREKRFKWKVWIMKRSISLVMLISLIIPQAFGQMEAYRSVYARIAQASIPGDALFGEKYASSIEEFLRPHMSDQYKYATTLNLFGAADAPMLQKAFIEQQTWQDLELFPHVFGAIDRTVTVFGRAELAHLIAGKEQCTDITELQRRQKVVKTLLANPALFDAMNKILTKFKEAEESFLIFFLDKNSYRQRLLSSFYFKKTVKGAAPGADEFYDTMDTSPNVLLGFSLLEKLALANSVVMLGSSGVSLVEKLNDMRKGELTSSKEREWAHATIPLKIGATLATAAVPLYLAWRSLNNTNETLTNVVSLPQRPFGIYHALKFQATATRMVHEDLIQLAQACKAMSKMTTFLAEKTKIKALMPECDGLFDMFENPINNSDELNQLLAMLRTSTFKGRSMLPSFLSHTGRIFAANRLMDVSKHEWVSVFKAIGQLDVYLSIAKLIKESEGKRVQYSFVNFIESDRPVLLLQDFWNPLINENDVVPNTITLGKSYGPRSMIITGPNSGGKSVVLKSVALSVLLAQTLGITPATKAMITPFSTINSLINVTDAIPSGLSRFRAEVAQAKGLSAKLKRQRSNEFNLVVSDELFSSTSEDQAEELIYEYAKAFATPNNICLQATHHPKYMVQLEQEVKDGSINVFGNYKVDIDQLPEGKLKRNYKLERGVSSQKFAKKILEEVGALPA